MTTPSPTEADPYPAIQAIADKLAKAPANRTEAMKARAHECLFVKNASGDTERLRYWPEMEDLVAAAIAQAAADADREATERAAKVARSACTDDRIKLLTEGVGAALLTAASAFKLGCETAAGDIRRAAAIRSRGGQP